MRQSLDIICVVLLLASCAFQARPQQLSQNLPVSSESSHSSSSVPSKDGAYIFAVPPELSIQSFQEMRLEGSNFLLGKVLADDAAYTRYAISYVSNGLRITGILNVPKGVGPFPLLLLNHGYIHPQIYTQGRGLKREQDYFARNGFAVLHSDYRGHAGSDESPDTRKIYDAGLEYSMDVVNGLQAIRSAAIPGIDADYVGMLGHSMGGGIALNIAVAYPELIDAIVLYAPVNSNSWNNFDRWRRERDDDDRTEEVFGTYEEHPELWDALSSQTYLHRIQTPILIFHGDKDKDVPKVWSDDLVLMLQDLGKNITYVEYPAEGHEFATQWSDFMKRSREFFAERLK